MIMIPRTREFRNGAFVVRFDVPLKRNNTQEVKNREDDLIDQQFVKLLAKAKALLLEFKTKQKKHYHESQDTGILKRSICSACR